MKQLSLFSYVSSGGLEPGTPIVDLFCGIGGFGCGAKQAGHKIVLAVDSCPSLLGCHVRNNVDCEHICAKLPRDDLPLPTGKWHLHGSPPCTKLSIMQPLQDPRVRGQAKDLVSWFLELAESSKASSWSMEQVNNKFVRDTLSEMKLRSPLKVDWIVVDAVNFEVPQHRKRIIAGSPFLIANLRSFKSKKRKLCIRDVIPRPPSEFVKNSLYSRPDYRTGELQPVPLKDQLRSVDKPSYTILSTGHKKWCDSEGNVLRHVRGHEAAAIQTFPPDYKLPWCNVEALAGVGNAVPPRLAEILMQPV